MKFLRQVYFMDEKQLRKSLADLPLGGIRFFKQTGSTNDVALAWATEGAADLSLVVADEQTSGRGRLGRRWLTPPGTALALSLILHPKPTEYNYFSLFSGLGSLALTQILSERGLPAQVKWPNDVLIADRKTAGILVEAESIRTSLRGKARPCRDNHASRQEVQGLCLLFGVFT